MEVLFGAAAGMVPCLLFGGFAALIIVAVVYGLMKARERREAMARLAAGYGLRYYADDPYNLAARYAGFDLFSQGHGRLASNVAAGEVEGQTLVLFDYRYKTGSGKNETTHHCQAAVLGIPIVAPRLRLRREHFLDRVASWVGYDDIDFESDEFSRTYHVRCTDRKFAYDIFHARLIDYLLQCGRVPAIEMGGPVLLLYESGLGRVENFERLVAIGRTIVNMVPDYVRKERGATAAKGD